MLNKLAAALHNVGAQLLRFRREGLTNGIWQGTQFKAEADIIADDLLREHLLKILNIPIISEEDQRSQVVDRPEEYWLIDPIDGTASFANGFAGFVTQVAWIKKKHPQVAGVFAPELKKLYLAERSNGATLNGKKILVRPVNKNRLTIVDNYPKPKGMAKWLFDSMLCSEYLECGSIGLKICLVAEGQADIFVKNIELCDWDIAAPHLILHEAGGVLKTINGSECEYHGSYEKKGLIAVATNSLCQQIKVYTSLFDANQLSI